MASNPDIIAPSVDPNTRAPNDLINVQVTPASFGAPVAQGLGAAAQGLHEANDFWNGVQTDAALNDAFKTGQQQVADFQKLNGADATNNLPAAKAAMEETFKAAGAKLPTEGQRVRFDNASRAYIDRTLAPQLDHHANETGRAYAIDTGNDAFKEAANRAAIHADNPEEVLHARADAEAAYTTVMKAKYGLNLTPDQQAEATSAANKAVYTSQVQALSVKSPAAAQKILETHQADLGENYAPLAEHLQNRADQNIGWQAGREAIARAGQGLLNGTQPGAIPNATVPVTPTIQTASAGPTPQANALLNVISGPESRGNYNALWSGNGPLRTFQDFSQFPQWEGLPGPAGPSHAAGAYQFEPATWAAASKAVGASDFSPQSQDRAAWWLASSTYQNKTGRDLQTDLSNGKTDLIPDALKGQWGSINQNSVTRLNHDLQTANTGSGNLPSSAFKASAFDQLLADPQLRDNPRAFQHAMTFVNEQYSAASIASMQNEQARKQASDTAAQGIVTDALNGKIDGLPQRIANDPSLSWETKLHLTNSLEGMMKRDLGKDTQTYGPEFWNAYQRIHLPDSDPFKITKPQQLYEWGPKGDLTMAGIDKLTQEMNSKKTPEGEAESAMRLTFMKNASQQISGKNQLLGFADPKGEEQFLKFQAWFFPEYEKQRAAGVSSAELMDPSSPKYLGKNIGAFKRTPEQEQADLFAANPILGNGTQSGAAPPANQNVDTSTPKGVADAYRGGQISYAQAADALRKLGFADRQAAPVGTGVPLAH